MVEFCRPRTLLAAVPNEYIALITVIHLASRVDPKVAYATKSRNVSSGLVVFDDKDMKIESV